ncbi:MAG: OmpH family outer membrane protein [Paludibacteraceae bacterium]|nr:OmpH family outer membrane protein [Paludibacteraceae bacterium]
MKKIIILIALALPMIASAQKFGYINTQELFALMPEAKQAEDSLLARQQSYQTMYEEMVTELQNKQKEYEAQAATASEAVNQLHQQELQDLYQRIQMFQQTIEQDLQTLRQNLLAPIHERMMKAIDKVGKAETYTYVLDSAATVFVGTDASDLMPAVKKELGIK